jgi:hypothetical protein
MAEKQNDWLPPTPAQLGWGLNLELRYVPFEENQTQNHLFKP